MIIVNQHTPHYFRSVSLCIIILLFSTYLFPALGETGTFSDLTEFDSVMMPSVAEQISSAADLTDTDDNCAILAAILTLEYTNQQRNFTMDFTKPMYVCKQDDIASVAFSDGINYVIVIFQSKPLYTGYGILYDNDSATVKSTLELTNESVKQVSLTKYNEKMKILIDQL